MLHTFTSWVQSKSMTIQTHSLYYLWLLCFIFLGSAMTSCSSDDEITQEAPAETYITQAKTALNGDIVLSTKATMSGVDKTHLESGCPTKFNFKWNDDGTMTLSLVDFTVGSMPFAVTFKCKTKFMNLNSWEKDEYRGNGWIKFQGKDGNVTTIGEDAADNQKGSGASVDGYFNANTDEIEFIINYNLMNVRTETFKQVIDKNRINNFDEEFAQYERDLIQWKKDHGQG